MGIVVSLPALAEPWLVPAWQASRAGGHAYQLEMELELYSERYAQATRRGADEETHTEAPVSAVSTG